MDIDYTLMADDLSRIIETAKAKAIDCRRLPAYNVDKAGDTVINQLRAFMHTVGISDNYFFQVFIVPQVVASLTTPTNFSLARARVRRENKGTLAYAVVPGQGHNGVKGEGIGCMSLLAIWERELVTSTRFGTCVETLITSCHADFCALRFAWLLAQLYGRRDLIDLILVRDN